MVKKQNQQESKQKFGTLTALNDANGDYSSSESTSSQTTSTFGGTSQNSSGFGSSSQATSSTSQASSSKQKASKSQYGTMTAKEDVNNDYE